MKANRKIASILVEYYNISDAKVTKLSGYENENYLVFSSGKKYVLKTYLYNDTLFDIVKAEREVLLQLKGRDKYDYPVPVALKNGEFEVLHNEDDSRLIIRMLSYIEGEPIGYVRQTTELYESFGAFLAQLDKELLKITNKTIERRKSEWNIVYFDKNKKLLSSIKNYGDREILSQIFENFESIVKPSFSRLRHSIIHNDANDFNVMTSNGKVTGIIDFGDLAYAPLIDELAVAIAYSGFGKDNPLKWARTIIESYSKVISLDDNELEILYHIITARLATTIVNAAYSRITYPSNKYAYTSENDAWKTLKWWLRTHPNPPFPLR